MSLNNNCNLKNKSKNILLSIIKLFLITKLPIYSPKISPFLIKIILLAKWKHSIPKEISNIIQLRREKNTKKYKRLIKNMRRFIKSNKRFIKSHKKYKKCTKNKKTKKAVRTNSI